jgi:hypothetical protein
VCGLRPDLDPRRAGRPERSLTDLNDLLKVLYSTPEMRAAGIPGSGKVSKEDLSAAWQSAAHACHWAAKCAAAWRQAAKYYRFRMRQEIADMLDLRNRLEHTSRSNDELRRLLAERDAEIARLTGGDA